MRTDDASESDSTDELRVAFTINLITIRTPGRRILRPSKEIKLSLKQSETMQVNGTITEADRNTEGRVPGRGPRGPRVCRLEPLHDTVSPRAHTTSIQ